MKSPTPARDLSELLRRLAARHRERAAVTDPRGVSSFAALDRSADAWARRFLRLGLGRGSRVGLLAGNRPEWLAAAFGVWRAGATLVPISTFVTPRELEETLAHGDVEALVLQARLRSHDYRAMLAELTPSARPREVLSIDSAPGAEGPDAFPELDPASIACILYTSGTTGRPKGVMLAHSAILATVAATAERSGLDDRDALLSTLPLFWVAGLAIRALPTLAAGCTLHLLETFTPGEVIAALRRHRPTALHLRPPQVGQVVAHPDFDPALLASVRKGNGRIEWFAPHLDPTTTSFITGYGMTEMAGYVTALDWRESVEEKGRGLGLPLPGVEIRITDERGAPRAAGDAGEIRLRGPGLFSGYHREVAGTGLDGAGFFVTGDLGRIDSSGRLHFVGRTKDLLRVKGVNVSPLEVEGVLSAHPGVEAVYVVGLPPGGIEQQLVALIVARSATHDLEAELRGLAAEALSHYKRPERYLAVGRDEVPLGGTSKPRRDALASLAESRLRPSP